MVVGSRTSSLINRRNVSRVARKLRLLSSFEATNFVREVVGIFGLRLLKMFTMYAGAL